MPKPTNCPTRSISASARSRPPWRPSRIGPSSYDPAEIARAGVFVSIDGEGALRVERGFVRPEDEAPVEPVAGGETEGDGETAVAGTDGAVQRAVITIGGAPASSEPEAPRRTRRSVRFRIGW